MYVFPLAHWDGDADEAGAFLFFSRQDLPLRISVWARRWNWWEHTLLTTATEPSCPTAVKRFTCNADASGENVQNYMQGRMEGGIGKKLSKSLEGYATKQPLKKAFCQALLITRAPSSESQLMRMWKCVCLCVCTYTRDIIPKTPASGTLLLVSLKIQTQTLALAALFTPPGSTNLGSKFHINIFSHMVSNEESLENWKNFKNK